MFIQQTLVQLNPTKSRSSCYNNLKHMKKWTTIVQIAIEGENDGRAFATSFEDTHTNYVNKHIQTMSTNNTWRSQKLSRWQLSGFKNCLNYQKIILRDINSKEHIQRTQLTRKFRSYSKVSDVGWGWVEMRLSEVVSEKKLLKKG